MTSSEPDLRPKERRKRADWLMVLLVILNVLCWFLLIAGLTLAHFAKPEFNSGLVQYWGIVVDLTWDTTLLLQLELLLHGCLLLTAVTLALYQLRSRRKTDGWRLNLLFLLCLSAILSFMFSGI
jgi:hypothetical protein